MRARWCEKKTLSHISYETAGRPEVKAVAIFESVRKEMKPTAMRGISTCGSPRDEHFDINEEGARQIHGRLRAGGPELDCMHDKDLDIDEEGGPCDDCE